LEKRMKYWKLVIAIVVLSSCQEGARDEAATATESSALSSAEQLAASLAAQPDDVRARYAFRHPQETLEFFGIERGMTVLEGLPGGGWYTRVLLPFLGADGGVIGANYSLQMYPLFSFVNEEYLEQQRAWQEDFVADAKSWRAEPGASAEAFYFGSMPQKMAGTADAVVFVRVLHNLARFESEGDYLTIALADMYRVLKPGGIFGVVQHEARASMSDAFADGNRGYLKKAFVIAAIEEAGFVFIAESDINANAADQPGVDDIVWRLPPSYATSRDDAELKAKYTALGESNRMTLKFRKPE
jgi:predicted methyltransferase